MKKNEKLKVEIGGRDWTAELGDKLKYDDAVSYYGNDSAAKLKVDSSYSKGKVEIWSNGWDGKIYNNVKGIDASEYMRQTILVGNSMENTITASEGKSSLWSGEGAEMQKQLNDS